MCNDAKSWVDIDESVWGYEMDLKQKKNTMKKMKQKKNILLAIAMMRIQFAVQWNDDTEEKKERETSDMDVGICHVVNILVASYFLLRPHSVSLFLSRRTAFDWHTHSIY